jgi:hypothetical protein
VTPEDRAKAIVAHFAQQIPPCVREEMQSVIARGIKRALAEQLSQLEIEAQKYADAASGKGKTAKGRNETAIFYHSEWAWRFRQRRTGKPQPHPLDLLARIEKRSPQ